MESQLQNPEFRNNHENFHPCIICFNSYQLKLTYPTATTEAEIGEKTRHDIDPFSGIRVVFLSSENCQVPMVPLSSPLTMRSACRWDQTTLVTLH